MDTPAMPTTPVDPSQEATIASPQATGTAVQTDSLPQPSATSPVETGVQSSSQEDPRKASDFETARQIKRLEKTIRSMQQTFERSSQSQAVPGIPQPQRQATPISNEEFIKDPIGNLIRVLDERDQRLKGEIPQQFQQMNEASRHENARQEALRLIKTNDSVKADPEGEERVADILTEVDDDGNSLEKYSLLNPKHAAQLALKEYQRRHGGTVRSPSAPTKAQMQTTATAVTANAPKGNLDQEAAQLYRKVLADPNLMADPEFRSQLDAFDKKQRMALLQNK